MKDHEATALFLAAGLLLTACGGKLILQLQLLPLKAQS